MSESPNDAFPAAIRAEIEKRIGAFEYSQIGCGNFAEEVWKLCRRPDPAPVGVRADLLSWWWQRTGHMAPETAEMVRELLRSLTPQPGAVVGDEIIGQLADWYREHESRHGDRLQGPGHAHLRPGFWDDDNGKLAGKPCALCRLWETARAAATLTNTDKGVASE